MFEPTVEFVGEEHVAQLRRRVPAPAFGCRVGVWMREFLCRAVVRVGHAGELRGIMRPARDDDDAGGRGELLEQTGHHREVAKMVDAEGHFDAVGW